MLNSEVYDSCLATTTPRMEHSSTLCALSTHRNSNIVLRQNWTSETAREYYRLYFNLNLNPWNFNSSHGLDFWFISVQLGCTVHTTNLRSSFHQIWFANDSKCSINFWPSEVGFIGIEENLAALELGQWRCCDRHFCLDSTRLNQSVRPGTKSIPGYVLALMISAKSKMKLWQKMNEW